MYVLKTDATVTAAYSKDDKGDVLHQSLEETPYGVTLKGYAVRGGRLTLNITLAQMMGILDVAGTGLGSGVRFVFRDNENIRRTDTFTYDSEEINLWSGVDWVFTMLHSPWSTRYIPETAYQHVDINCDMIIPQQANNNTSKYVLHHTEVPDDDSLVIPHERMYMKLNNTSYSSAQIWIRHEPPIRCLHNQQTNYMVAWRYGISLLVFNSLSFSFAAITSYLLTPMYCFVCIPHGLEKY